MKFKQAMLVYSIAGALAAVSGTAAASGFALIEQSASGLGNAYAGGAASAEDASTIFYNPAGMSRLSGKQIAVAVNAIKPSAKFSDTGSALPAPRPLNGNGGDAGSLGLVPNAYFSMEATPAMHVGLGINAPFGLQTQYDANWIGRFQAIKSKIETINLNPSVSYKLNDAVSIGAGLNYQRITGELTSAVNLVVAEGASSVTGSDAAWGFDLGAMFNVSPQTRVGVAYRSRIKYNISGSVVFTGGVPAANGPITLAITTPDSFSASAFHQLSDKWDIMGDASWTGWSVLQQLNVVRTTGASILTVQENWRDTWRVSVGANYHYNDQWLARVGIAYDQTPVSDAFRTARIPDGNRTWLSVGGQCKPNKESAVDIGYAHLFVSNASISDLQGATAFTPGKGNLVGNYSNSVDILSVQYTHSF
ncbi:MAG: outer membrane protein transport protein [Betaproteobacteria bacterium]|nr:outer membrane protein transport protein [Betaproteobacteria bacterium]